MVYKLSPNHQVLLSGSNVLHFTEHDMLSFLVKAATTSNFPLLCTGFSLIWCGALDKSPAISAWCQNTFLGLKTSKANRSIINAGNPSLPVWLLSWPFEPKFFLFFDYTPKSDVKEVIELHSLNFSELNFVPDLFVFALRCLSLSQSAFSSSVVCTEAATCGSAFIDPPERSWIIHTRVWQCFWHFSADIKKKKTTLGGWNKGEMWKVNEQSYLRKTRTLCKMCWTGTCWRPPAGFWHWPSRWLVSRCTQTPGASPARRHWCWSSAAPASLRYPSPRGTWWHRRSG